MALIIGSFRACSASLAPFPDTPASPLSSWDEWCRSVFLTPSSKHQGDYRQNISPRKSLPSVVLTSFIFFQSKVALLQVPSGPVLTQMQDVRAHRRRSLTKHVVLLVYPRTSFPCGRMKQKTILALLRLFSYLTSRAKFIPLMRIQQIRPPNPCGPSPARLLACNLRCPLNIDRGRFRRLQFPPFPPLLLPDSGYIPHDGTARRESR